MKYKIFWITVLTLFCVKAAAQGAGGRITGIVVDEAEDTPLTGAVNIVLKEYPDHYADLSYSHESFNVDKAGVFTYNPGTEDVKQVISLSGNLNYIHFFD